MTTGTRKNQSIRADAQASPLDAYPRTTRCIEAVMRQHPGETTRALARYYEAVHQELAPLARQMEDEVQELMRALDNVRLFAARHRREEWAQTVLTLCAGAGVTAAVLRGDDVRQRP